MIIKSPCSIQRKPRKKGFTLTEIAIVLGIIGLILGAIWSAASGVYANTAASTVSQSLGQYVANVRSLCNNTSCTGLNPITGVSSASPVPSNSGITATASDLAGAEPGFVITWTGIPQSSGGSNFCNGLASAVVGMSGSAAGTAAAAASPPATPTATCTKSGTSYVPTCTVAAGYTSSTAKATCTSAGVAGGTCGTPSSTPTTLCQNSPKTLSAWFPYSFN